MASVHDGPASLTTTNAAAALTEKPSQPKQAKVKIPPWQNALCGATAGVVSRFVIAPLDVIKIRFQLQTGALTPLKEIAKNTLSHIPSARTAIVESIHAGGAPSTATAAASAPMSSTTTQATTTTEAPKKYRGVVQSFSRIVREEGYRGLWKGNLSAEYLYLTYGAVQFYTYNRAVTFINEHKAKSAQQRHDSGLPAQLSSLLQHLPAEMVAGALAGCAATVSTYPFDLLRTRFAVQGAEGGPYTGLMQAVGQIARTEGIRGFYRGVWPSVMQMMPQMGIVFASYRILNDAVDGTRLKGTGLESFLTGGLAGMIGKSAVMPFDVVRKRLQIQGPTRTSYVVGSVPAYPRSFIRCGLAIARSEGVRALYKGIVPAVLKAGPSAAVTFMVVGACERACARQNERGLTDLV
ncbi:mitochondrial thiamine pyrophosphate carrier 1 [Fimicolochytrium jonesii]|uniref:mitochondrial thiamine pyrophosphate carrier 1 n=1 Tax=Fimicolochytrium jonesii TaxID=1396493 RepID=UPI0022FEBDB4|nr:mitochondrial thiamine pyrophosphate carrier 1 [Fimicolochytrium jonesii]KAI8821788.1 mitochondrial thiamine pyrophosphate carrier 1 [Fimicolochytrium jonesii]